MGLWSGLADIILHDCNLGLAVVGKARAARIYGCPQIVYPSNGFKLGVEFCFLYPKPQILVIFMDFNARRCGCILNCRNATIIPHERRATGPLFPVDQFCKLSLRHDLVVKLGCCLLKIRAIFWGQ